MYGCYDASYAHKKWELDNVLFKKSQCVFRHKAFNDFFFKNYKKNYHGVEATLKLYQEKTNKKGYSVKTIYKWIKSNIWVLKMNNRLRKAYVKNGKRKTDYKVRLTNGNKYVYPIAMRPKDIDKREKWGHWEIHLVIGRKMKGHHNLLTLTERKTRFTYIKRVKSKFSLEINKVLKKIIEESKYPFLSITSDNGFEFQSLGLVAHENDLVIYKAQTYCSFQRGSNENINGLIRRKHKKGFDFTNLTDEQIQELQDKINNMPRKIFGFKSSKEIAEQEYEIELFLLNQLPDLEW
ncbi:IS30 family transposase [Mycoplasmopsis anatis]|uniref:IS30 family transposase n=1 Tax=Mycoplasmopsis anatis TaxID=171279 RepID=UPI0029621D5B|nr:IS30 family transposase [Mycoplasmopsis anatis]